MFDRKNMISAESGMESIRLGAKFMPARLVPKRADGSMPDRLIWGEFDDKAFQSPFTDEDLIAQAPGIRWFFTSLDVVEHVNVNSNPIPLRGVVMQMSRCGSTLSRMLLGQTNGAFTLSEPMIVNLTLVGSPAPRFGEVMRAVFSGKAGPFERAYLKCTSWNVLHGDHLLDAMDGPPAIFIHRDPAEVLVSLHHSKVDWYSRLFIGDTPPESPPDPTTGNARFLAGMLEAAIELEDAGRLRFVAYEDILDRFIDGDLPEYLGYEVDEATRSRMLSVARMNSKEPGQSFKSDRAEKKRVASEIPAIRKAASELTELHAEACRRSAWHREDHRSSAAENDGPRR